MASSSEGRYSRFLRRVLPWAVGAGVIAGAAIAATLLAGGQAAAQPLTIPGVGTFEVPDEFSIPNAIPGVEASTDGHSSPASIPTVAESAVLSEIAPAEVQGKELSAPLVSAELSVPSVAGVRSALPLVSAIGDSVAPVELAPVVVPENELSAPFVGPGVGFTVPLRVLGIERSALPLVPAIGDSVAPVELAPVVVPGKELSIPLAVPGADFSAPLAVLRFERLAPLAVPGMETAAPLAVPGSELSAPLAVPEPERSVPLAVPGLELSMPATIPGTGIPLPTDAFRRELSFLTGVLGIKLPTPTPAPAVAPERTHGAIAVDAARGKVGTGYSMGATGPDAFDCSGLVQWSYGQAGVKVPRTSYEQLSAGTPVAESELEPGDMVSFYGGSHSALYAGDGKVIHASTYGVGVTTSPMSSMPYAGARRF